MRIKQSWALIALVQCAHASAAGPQQDSAEATEPLDSVAELSFELDAWQPSDDTFWAPAKFTFGYELGAREGGPARAEWVNHRGSFRLEYEKHFWSGLFLRLDSKLTAFMGRDHRARARDEQVFVEALSKDAYLQYSAGDNSFTLGRRVLVWGESETGAITDVISPRNFSELFFISLEESRISQAMLSYERFAQGAEWSAFYIPEPGFNRYPRTGTAYDLAPPESAVRVRDTGRNSPELGGRWKRSIGNSDLSLMLARLSANDPVLRAPAEEAQAEPVLLSDAQRFDMVGLAFNHARGEFLVAGEFAYKSKLAFSTEALQTREQPVWDASLRGEYSLGKGGAHSLGLELANSHVLGWTPALVGAPRNRTSLALTWNNSFLNDTLTANVLAIANRPYSSQQLSVFLAYKWSDRTSLNLDAFYLHSGDARSELFAFSGQKNLLFRVLYQF